MEDWSSPFEEVPLSPPSAPLSIDDEVSLSSFDSASTAAASPTLDEELLREYVLELRAKCATVMRPEMQQLIRQRMLKDGLTSDWYSCMAWAFLELQAISRAEMHVLTNFNRVRSTFRTLDDVRDFCASTVETAYDVRASDVKLFCSQILNEYEEKGFGHTVSK